MPYIWILHITNVEGACNISEHHVSYSIVTYVHLIIKRQYKYLYYPMSDSYFIFRNNKLSFSCNATWTTVFKLILLPMSSDKKRINMLSKL